MKYLIPYLLLTCVSSAQAETFQQITSTFPLGTDKQSILSKEPSARVILCMVSPIDPAAQRESIVLMKPATQSRLIVQFYLVDDKLAAMMLSRPHMPGTPDNKQDDINYVSSKKRLSTFPALRVDHALNPSEVKVEEFAFGRPDHVALLVSTDRGSELWIVDKHLFNPKSFFMEPTDDNRNKVWKTKEAIEAQKKSYEELNRDTEQGAAANRYPRSGGFVQTSGLMLITPSRARIHVRGG